MKHDHGNDGPAMPASVAHRGRDLFDHSHEREERGGGHQHHHDHHHHHHQSPVDAPDAQDGMVAVIGGSAIAAGEGSAVTGFVENFAENMGRYSIATGEAVFQASAYSSEPGGAGAAASTFLDVSGADFIFYARSDKRSKDSTMPRRARNSTTSRSTFMAGRRHTARSSSIWISPS